ncbi:MAG: CRTAC1 family protein [Planctomycetota bacterium]|nr:MAG: CRTAC1 family protein [Planctomycetota bacterium]
MQRMKFGRSSSADNTVVEARRTIETGRETRMGGFLVGDGWGLFSNSRCHGRAESSMRFGSAGDDFNRCGLCGNIALATNDVAAGTSEPAMTPRHPIDQALLFLCLAGVGASCDRVSAQVVFEDVTDAAGLEGLGGGTAAWADYDNDGWVDLYTDGQLWKNEQGERFVRVADAGVAGQGIWADFDNDGWLDLFSWVGTGRVFRNIEGKAFASDVPLPEPPMPVSLGACWGDFDGDGFVDVYLGGYESPSYLTDAIFQNREGESFEQVWQTEGKLQPARGITAADFDEDGDLDVYVSNYRLEPNLLWQNDGHGVFTDVSSEFGTAGDGGLGAWGHTIGSSWGDLDNDGHFDLFVGNFSHPPDYQDRPKFLRNMGPEGGFHFEDKTGEAGLHWQESYASPALADFDNDGLLDLFFTTVYPGDRSVLYHNDGDWKFTNSTHGSNVDKPQTYQAAWADYDNDGWLDLVTGGRLLRNPGGAHHWLKVRLIGGEGVNEAAIGTVVRIPLEDQVLTRQVAGATGQGNQNDLTLHFGLGAHEGPVTLNITWPGGESQTVETGVDELVTVRYGG